MSYFHPYDMGAQLLSKAHIKTFQYLIQDLI